MWDNLRYIITKVKDPWVVWVSLGQYRQLIKSRGFEIVSMKWKKCKKWDSSKKYAVRFQKIRRTKSSSNIGKSSQKFTLSCLQSSNNSMKNRQKQIKPSKRMLTNRNLSIRSRTWFIKLSTHTNKYFDLLIRYS